jgi:hypothetical protein
MEEPAILWNICAAIPLPIVDRPYRSGADHERLPRECLARAPRRAVRGLRSNRACRARSKRHVDWARRRRVALPPRRSRRCSVSRDQRPAARGRRHARRADAERGRRRRNAGRDGVALGRAALGNGLCRARLAARKAPSRCVPFFFAISSLPEPFRPVEYRLADLRSGDSKPCDPSADLR